MPPHTDLTNKKNRRQEKEIIMQCSGKLKDGKNCRARLYRCKKCNSVGCDADGCSNQINQKYRCMKCGIYGNAEKELLN